MDFPAAHDDFMTDAFREIDEAVRLFWRQIKRQRPRTSRIYPEIEFENVIYSNPVDIAKCFAQHFESIYNRQDNGAFDADFFRSIGNSYDELETFSILKEKSIPGEMKFLQSLTI
jgi:hypothetical protein